MPRVKPLYWKTQGEGEDFLKVENVFYCGGTKGKFNMNPYLDFIPVMYLYMNHNDCFTKKWIHNEGWLKRSLSGSLHQFIPKITEKELLNYAITMAIARGAEITSSLHEELTEYIYFDKNISLGATTMEWANTSTKIQNSFFTKFSIMRMRSYNGIVGPLSLFLDGENEKVPLILGVVLPENYIYQKMHIMMHNTLDMTKVILLVDRELDSTQFPNKPLRALYKKYLEPEYKKYNMDIWKVPKEFILENCFQKDHSLQGKTILEKKKEISTLIQTFKEEYASVSEPEQIPW